MGKSDLTKSELKLRAEVLARGYLRVNALLKRAEARKGKLKAEMTEILSFLGQEAIEFDTLGGKRVKAQRFEQVRVRWRPEILEVLAELNLLDLVKSVDLDEERVQRALQDGQIDLSILKANSESRRSQAFRVDEVEVRLVNLEEAADEG